MKRIAVIGAGNMGSALLGGILKVGVADRDHLIATVRTPERAEELAAKYDIPVTAGGNPQAVARADIVVLAVKPGTLPKVLEEIRETLRGSQILLSLAAAVPISLIESIFRAVGVVVFVEEELMHAVTALSGSGPAYVYMVIEALIAGGLKMGLSREVSTRLAEQTVLGAAKLVRETMLHPAILRDQVITPGGVTISAIHELEKHGLRSMLISAIETATHHSEGRTRALLAKFGDS